MTAAPSPAAIRLYDKSVLKQAKFRALSRYVGDPARRRCLDLGADNGVLSYLLRERGGSWASADLSAKAVQAIHDLVGGTVCRIDGRRLPFAGESFDLVVVIDMLEHVDDDRGLVAEIARVLRPSGELVVNVPHHKRWSVTRPLRQAAGLTDEWHGHVRPGYDVEALERLLEPSFALVEHDTYGKVFSEILDIALNYAYARRRGTTAAETAKGTIVTATDVAAHETDFRRLSRLYPALKLFAGADVLCAGASGHSLVARARKRPAANACTQRDPLSARALPAA